MNHFTQLVALADDGELRASSEVIAAGMEYEHKTVIQLVRKYILSLERFGLVAFEMRARPHGQHGGGDVEFACLNEQQTALLISLMRNKEKVVEFKISLVSEFFRMREALRARENTTWERRLALETKDVKSSAKGRLGSKLMNERKSDLTTIRPERESLKLEMEPGLFRH